MTSFIYDVLIDLKKKNKNLSELIFILPSKRAGIVLRRELAHIEKRTLFAPLIYSIEEFSEELSGLKSKQKIELLFLFYEVYQNETIEKHQEPFDSFLKWAQILLQDFNEIDRYLIDPKHIFNYLHDIQKINSDHWSLSKNQTSLTNNYLVFWSQLHNLYESFTRVLINSGSGYQGLIYREATENIENYIQANTNKHHVFVGFNALNTAESTIIQELLNNGVADVYWDIDEEFMNSEIHTASHFIKNHRSEWPHYQTHPFNFITNNFKTKKKIQIIGVPQNIGQAKVIGETLHNLKKTTTIDKTAVVLGDESLLIPVLNSLPNQLNTLNITMGFPLKETPLTSLFELLFSVHVKQHETFYHKDVISVLSHQYICKLLNKNTSEDLVNYIKKQNLIHISKTDLQSLSKENEHLISLLFGHWKNDPNTAIDNCLSLILLIKNNLRSKKDNALSLEYLYRFHEVFNILFKLNQTYASLTSIKSLESLFKELIASETLDFKGEPLQGLQLMGMLESRVLDFETVIISSVNEGILPSGKTNNSFIPFDVKIEVGLPTYREKDAVYTYHFYRLLQRAKQIFIIYNTEVDALNGGENSRFISQLEIENHHLIEHQILSPKIPKVENSLVTISKNKKIITKLKAIAAEGFSPSSLTTYIKNPPEFYFRKVLGVKENENVEEVVAANTLGTVIHNTLEDFYKPLEGCCLSIKDMDAMIAKINITITKHFSDVYKKGSISKGKNLIIFEIAKRYVLNFLNFEKASLKKGHQIKIISIENNLSIPIDIKELNFPIRLKGKVDRIDEFDGVTRIIDYKTGKVEQRDVNLENWNDLTINYDKHHKSFQVLCYAYMIDEKILQNNECEAGIISFKNLSSGFLKFQKIDKLTKPVKKHSIINDTIITDFCTELKKLIIEMFNSNIDFIQKHVS